MDDAITIVHGEINQLSNRAAMGLPESYTSPTYELVQIANETLIAATPEKLADAIGDMSIPFQRRLSLAGLLALRGDPRLNVYDPPMVDVPGGAALLGLARDRIDPLFEKYQKYGVQRNWIEKECPRFEVELPPFRIGKYSVTNIEYLAYLKDAPNDAAIPSTWVDGRMPFGRDNHPVHTVTAEEADKFCVWLSSKTGRRFRLPTEYEWEYAAAGPEGRDYPWGDSFEKTPVIRWN